MNWILCVTLRDTSFKKCSEIIWIELKSPHHCGMMKFMAIYQATFPTLVQNYSSSSLDNGTSATYKFSNVFLLPTSMCCVDMTLSTKYHILGLAFNNYMLTRISVWVWITEHWSVRSFETSHTMPTHVYIFDEEGIYHIWFSNCRIKRNLGCRKLMLFHIDDTCKLNVRPIINIEKINQNPVMAIH